MLARGKQDSEQQDVADLVRRARQGEREALDLLLARYRPYLKLLAERSVRPTLRSRFDGSDIVQQTCCDAFLSIAKLRGTTEAEFNVWINTILRNNVTGFLRRHTADRRDIRKERTMDADTAEVTLEWHDGVAPTATPASRVIRGEAALLIAHALNELPVDERTAIQMRFLDTYSLTDIATCLDTSPSKAVRLIDRGLQSMHDALPQGLL